MASNKVVRFGPVALGTSAANLINPPTLSGGAGLSGTNSNAYVIIRHLRVVNKSANAASASLYIGASGASAAGTEFAFNNTSIPANGNSGNYVDWYGAVRLDVADFLTGLASAATALVIEGEGEVGVA
ncbi:hypothetical protein ACFSHT_22465 [Paraburkholderia silviterrae]|uniref:Uncharacterized protein n=1 Tax=Paraburkholderia silviterrae TaxID=2528715 RepID=A0A4R5MF31_9BURK|nr:hypothetical protein [Paraburkholderia silviterrae]TDG25855.1 hypothetical protein EYW47_00345 [Paraburkholderia silviterrae]